MQGKEILVPERRAAALSIEFILNRLLQQMSQNILAHRIIGLLLLTNFAEVKGIKSLKSYYSIDLKGFINTSPLKQMLERTPSSPGNAVAAR